MATDIVRDTILVVDDEPEMRRSIVRFVTSNFPDYETIEASDGAEALAQLSPRIALAICDVNMPNTDGFDFCRSLRNDPAYRAHAETAVIMLTSRDTEEDYEKSLEVGSTLFVTKPFDAERLRYAVSTALGD